MVRLHQLFRTFCCICNIAVFQPGGAAEVVRLAQGTDNLVMSTKSLETKAIDLMIVMPAPVRLENFWSFPMSRDNRIVGVAIEEGIATIRDALSALSYGSLVLTVHEGRLVQIDVTERKRFKLN
jgi:hypothetical protein